MRFDFVKIFLLFLVLCFPGFIILIASSTQSGEEAFAIISFSIFIISAPIIFFSSVRNYFLAWTPVTLLIPAYCYLILIYHSVPGDALISSIIHTRAAQSLEVLLSFGWKILIIPIFSLIYFFTALSINRELILSKGTRKILMAFFLMYAMINMVIRVSFNSYIKLPPMFEEYTFNLSFPSSIFMSISRIITSDADNNTKTYSLHGKIPADFPSSKIVVLIIGESARSDHLGINGYARDTTPYLNSLGTELISYKDVASTANSTYVAVPNLVLRPHEANRASLVQTFREAGFRTAWFSNQERSYFSKHAEISNFPDSDFDFHVRKDTSLLPLFESFVRQAGPYQFIVLHMEGSHVTYDERYTADSKKFSPTLSDIGISDPLPKNKQETINSYDNTIIEMDKFLYKVISILKNQNNPAILMYTSDHGENLFDDKRQLFMHTQFPPTRYDLHVPLLLWMNSAYDKMQPDLIKTLKINSQKEISHRSVFPSLLDIAGLDWDGKSEADSFASGKFNEINRMITSLGGNPDLNYDNVK